MAVSQHCGPWSAIPWGLWEPVLSRLREEAAGASGLQFLLNYWRVLLTGVEFQVDLGLLWAPVLE